MGKESHELISSEALMNCTRSMSMPTAFQISTMYWPTTWIFFRSPPILLFNCAK